MNFTLAILLLIAFIGSGTFFLIVSKDLKLERVEVQAEKPAPTEPTTSVEEQLAP